jgi:uncharacterized protein YndB with AHSA1/START domain
MRYRYGAVALCWVLFLTPPSVGEAEVTDARPEGFAIQVEVTVQAPPRQVYQHLIQDIGKWWESGHTYSGDATNLYLEAEAKGWFGERLPGGGSVRHMEVIAVFPEKLVRLSGALGPLQEYAITGAMTWKFAPADEGTQLTVTYVVGGYRPGGLADFARPVDQVLRTQVHRLQKFVETGAAD